VRVRARWYPFGCAGHARSFDAVVEHSALGANVRKGGRRDSASSFFHDTAEEKQAMEETRTE